MSKYTTGALREKFFMHILTVLRVGVWRNLAKIGIGDPLNRLVHVNKYRPFKKGKS